MTNPATTDRRDVAPHTNPIGGHDNIEKDAKSNLAEPLNKGAAKMPAAGRDSQISGVPQGATSGEAPTDVYGGLPHGVPPARSGQSQENVQPAAPRGDNPGRMDEQRAEGRDTVHVQSPRSDE